MNAKLHAKKQRSNYDGKIAGLYDMEETIGRGHFAEVKLARHVFTGEKVAVKVIDKTKLDEVSRSHLFQEVRCMKLVQHPNVVRLYEVIDTQTKLYLILELGDGGDMYDYIMKHDKGLSEDVARRYFRQIVQAISYCHKLHVVHRDLKPENVVFFEKLGIVKLTDFGFSNKFQPGRKLETSCGSLAYSAPEILLGDSYDAPAVDVWSLGVILYMLMCGEPPFREANDSETLTMIMDCKYHLPPHIDSFCRELIGKMLTRDPGNRASLDQILNHHWLTQGDHPPIPITPLVSRESLSEDDHSLIVQKMVDGRIAPKEEILQSIEKDAYNHITATYYLLAERRLRKKEEQTSYHLTKTQDKPNLAPLALSPSSNKSSCTTNQSILIWWLRLFACCCRQTASAARHSNGVTTYGAMKRVQGPEVSQADMFRRSTVDSLVSPQRTHPAPSAPGHSQASGQSNSEFLGRRCSLIREESMEEGAGEDMEDVEEREMKSSRSHEDHLSDDSDNRSSSGGGGSKESLIEQSAQIAHTRKTPHMRPLHSVRSSPQLLNQIYEEGESDDDMTIPNKICTLPPSKIQRNIASASPEILKRVERRKKRLTAGNRGTSCSSSDASDTDEADQHKRKEKLKHRFHRRDSSDHSSDTDGPGAPPGGSSGGNNRPFGGSGRDENNRDRHDDDNHEDKNNRDGSWSRNGGSGSGGGKHHKGTALSKDLDTDSRRKMSGLSMASHLSNLSLTSLTSRSSKYLMDTSTCDNQPNPDSNISVEAMNEENKHRSHVIHVRSKDFSDLMDTFTKTGEKIEGSENIESVSPSSSVINKDGYIKNTKPRRRSKEKMKMDINRNGLKADIMNISNTTSTPTESNQQGETQITTKTKCCRLI